MHSSNQQSYTHTLKQQIRDWGADLAGVADTLPLRALHLDPPDLLDPFTTAVSIAIHLPWATFGEIKDKPTLIYDEIYQTANGLLNQIAFKVARRLEDDGFYSIPIPASQLTDLKNWYGAISHKAVARMAGLGWQGKNLLLITPQYGSSVRLTTILTSAPLAVDGPVENRCGNCTECQKACPAGAIKGVNTDSHYESRNQALFFDKCVDQLKKHSRMLEARHSITTDDEEKIQPTYHKLICGLCIKACPFGKKPRRP